MKGWDLLSLGNRFEVAEDGSIFQIGTERELVDELIHYANTGEERGAVLACTLRTILMRFGIWHRYVVLCYANGEKPLTSLERFNTVLQAFKASLPKP